MATHHPVSPDAYATDEISLVEIWHFVRDGWVPLTAGALLGAAIGATIGFTTDDFYQANAVIVEAGSADGTGGGSALLAQFGGLANLAGVDVSGLRSRSRPALMILRSRSFAEQFVTRHNLWPHIYPDSWNHTTGTWLPEVERPPTPAQAGATFKNAYAVIPSEDIDGALDLQITWEDPLLAAQWANQMVALANEIARQRDIANATRTIDFLTSQIQQTNVVELQRVLYNLLESEQKTLMLANAREEYAFEMIDPAIVPDRPAGPNRLLFTVVGLIFGLIVVGMLLVSVRILRMIRGA